MYINICVCVYIYIYSVYKHKPIYTHKHNTQYTHTNQYTRLNVYKHIYPIDIVYLEKPEAGNVYWRENLSGKSFFL